MGDRFGGLMIAKFSVVALDCPDPLALAAFYQGIVGGTYQSFKPDDDWVQLKPAAGGVELGFQRVPNYQAPDWPDGSAQQAHLDFDAPDLDVAEEEVLAIGARKARMQPRPDRWRVYLDPAGHPFCIVLDAG